MIMKFLRATIFALSERPIERRRRRLKDEVSRADDERAKGVMSSLSRGSVLLQLEKAHLGGRGTSR